MAFFSKWKLSDWLGRTVSSAELTVEELNKIREKTAMKEAALRTSVGLIADLVSGCEIKVYENGKEIQNAIWYVLNVSANPNQTPAQVISQWIMRMYYNGESIMVPISNNLYVADSFSVEELEVKGNVYSNIAIGTFTSNRTFKADKVFSLKQCSPQIKKLVDEIYKTYSDLLEYAKKAYAQNSGEKYAVQLGSRPSGTAEEHEKFMETVKANLESFVTASSAAYPLNKDQSIQRLSASGTGAAASDYGTIRKDIYSAVAQILHIPAGLMDGSLTSVDQVLNQFLTTTIDPLTHMISQELTRKSFSRQEILSGSRISLDTTSIRHIDVLDMAANIDKLIASGFASIDEARHMTGMPELGTDWSTKHYITKNYQDITQPTTEGGE